MFANTATADSDTNLNWIVILGGIFNGLGAALLWTAQGRLIMQYSDGTDNGFLFSIFWALFNLSALVGGLLTFFYFGASENDDDDRDNSDTNTGSSALYLVFLIFILIGTAATQFLVSPEEIKVDGTMGSKTNLPLLAEDTEQQSPTRRRSRSRSSSKTKKAEEVRDGARIEATSGRLLGIVVGGLLLLLLPVLPLLYADPPTLHFPRRRYQSLTGSKK